MADTTTQTTQSSTSSGVLTYVLDDKDATKFPPLTISYTTEQATLSFKGKIQADSFVANNGSPITVTTPSSSPTVDRWSSGDAGAIYYNGGNVGIGTVKPEAKLQVDGIFRVNGHVGISTAPDNSEQWGQVFDIYNKFNAKFAIKAGDIEGRAMSHPNYWGAAAGMIVGTKTGHALSLATNATSRMTINAQGNIGIGISNPGDYKLNVEGGNTRLGGFLTVEKNGIPEATNDYHLELFSPNTNDFINYTKIRFHQHNQYWAWLGYHGTAQNSTGEFVFWNLNAGKEANIRAGEATFENSVTIKGKLSSQARVAYAHQDGSAWIQSLGVHLLAKLNVNKGDVIEVRLTGSATNSNFYYQIIEQSGKVTVLSNPAQVIQSSSWLSITATGLFKATEDTTLEFRVNTEKRDISGTITIFGLSLIAKVLGHDA